MSDYFKNYMNLTKENRQRHLDISSPCEERGGNSTIYRGVLAQYLNTPIPMGRIAVLAHACNNNKCSNPQHLYWATDRENIVEDGKKFGTFKSVWERMVDKHGYEEACRLQANGAQSKAGQGNKGKRKSEEHKRKISESLKIKNRKE
jgi:hypothetical protein